MIKKLSFLGIKIICILFVASLVSCQNSNSGLASDIAVEFINLSADGADNALTTKLTLTFDKDIINLNEDDITINSGLTGTTKGSLLKIGIGTYDLTISGITASGQVTLAIANITGYNINPKMKSAIVFAEPGSAAIIITFVADAAPLIVVPTIYLEGGDGRPTTVTLKVENQEQYSSIYWFINGTSISENGPTFVLNSANPAYNSARDYFLTVEVIKDEVPFSRTIAFTVET